MALIKGKSKTTFKGPTVKDLRRLYQRLDDAYVTVGVHSDAGDYEGTGVSVAQVALWNEYGTSRGTPERSFLRKTTAENESEIRSWIATAVKNISEKGWTATKGLSLVGLRTQLLIQSTMQKGIAPANSEKTLERKRALAQGETPLIATGKLLRSVTYSVHVPSEGSSGDKPEPHRGEEV